MKKVSLMSGKGIKVYKINTFWNNLMGERDEFSMENRAFNYVCIISFILLVISLFFDLYMSISSISWVITGLIILLSILYYYSRYKKKYKVGVVVFVFCSYSALVFNYFVNSGISGPTLCMFFITFVFLVILGKPRQYGLWLVLHLGTVIILLSIEYYYPQYVPDTYPSRLDRFLDMGIMCTLAIIFVFTLTDYLRGYYNAKSKLADERAQAIQEQNKQIIAQNKMLEQVNVEKNKLFSIISHDLKTPLDSIQGYLGLLSDHSLNEQEKTEIYEDLLEQTKYTSDLLMNLMSWAKGQMHGVIVNLRPHNLKVFLDEIIRNKISIAARKGIKITSNIDADVEIVCDKDMLHIVMRNLINNAIKFTNTNGEVTIRVARREGNAIVSVQDTGIGIPEDKRAEIFSLKTRSTYGTNNEKGIGLGLMMCKEFMVCQQGEIWFDSEVGKGSTFYISLPLTKLL